jgi:hypothetical protein
MHSIIKNVIINRNNNQKRFYKCQKNIKEIEIVYIIKVKYYKIFIFYI